MKVKSISGEVVQVGEKDAITKMQEQINELLATVLIQDLVIEQLKAASTPTE
jgi:hypothetical protein